MNHSFRKFISLNKSLKFEEKIFLIGIFFLPSAIPIGAFFLLIALIISIFKSNNILKDNWNYPILISIGLILFSTINITFFNYPVELFNYQKSFIWINLFNWITPLICFWGFQYFLITESQRLNFCRYILFGTLPVLFSCITQYIFKIYGPFSTMNGLIVWFQRPIDTFESVTGLFNNANYLAFWLSIVLPFALFFLKTSKYKFDKIIFSLIFINIVSFIFLTNSRNGLLSLVIVFFAFYKLKNVIIIILSSLFFTTIAELVIQLFNPSISFFDWLSRSNLLNKISALSFNYASSPRYLIFKSSLSFIKRKPIFGWGASTFPQLHQDSGSLVNAQHTHNIFLELAHNFGLPLAILLGGSIIFLLIQLYFSIKKSIYKNKLFDKSWLVSTSLILILNISDFTLYDGKINLLICTILAGSRCIIKANQNTRTSYL